MIHTFVLYGPIPSKKNSKRILKRGDKRFISSSEKYKKWELEAVKELEKQNSVHAVRVAMESVKWITLKITFGDNRRRDLTNTSEGVFDALVLAGILEDDNWKCTGTITLVPVGVVKDGAKAEIVMEV